MVKYFFKLKGLKINPSKFTNLGDIIHHDKDPNKLALIDLGGENGTRQYTYYELNELCNSVARGLEIQKIPKGSRVAILSENRAEYLFAYLGIMRAGLVAVPVNYKFPQEMIEFILDDCDASLVFCDLKRESMVPRNIKKVVFNSNNKQGFDSFIHRGPYNTVMPKPDDPAMFMYTTGTTHNPKGVILSHYSHIWTAEMRLGKNDWSKHRYLIAAPMYHQNALALTKLSIIAHATIILLPKFTVKTYLSAIEKYRCTWLTSVPTMIAMILEDKELFDKTDFSSVEFLRMASAPVSENLMEEIHKALPNVKVSNGFGTTETGPITFGPHPQGIKQPSISVGYPHPAATLRLVDGDNLNADKGVLQIKSPGVMVGYNKADTRNPPLTNPFTNDGFYITGDVFYRDNNNFHYFVGRSDDMFHYSGMNVYPGVIEQLLETHPDVQQAVVVPVSDKITGQKPAAFVVKKKNTNITARQLRQFCHNKAPAYQHPRWIWFLDSLPLGSTNKIDKNNLILLAQQNLYK